MMINKAFRYIKNYSLSTIPVITVILSVLLSILPYKISSFSLLMPHIVLIVIYYWSIFQPQRLPYLFILLVGLFKDIIESNVLGLNAVYYLLFQVMVRSQRKHIASKPFIVVWADFMFCLSIILLLPLLFAHFSANIHSFKLSIIFSQWLITIFAYVPVHNLLSKLNNWSPYLR